MLDVITMSSRGQFVIPKEIRNELGLEKQDKFVVVYDKDNILLKRISKREADEAMLRLMDKFADNFKKNRITEADIKDEIKKARTRK